MPLISFIEIYKHFVSLLNIYSFFRGIFIYLSTILYRSYMTLKSEYILYRNKKNGLNWKKTKSEIYIET